MKNDLDMSIEETPVRGPPSRVPWLLLVLVLVAAGAAGYFGLQSWQSLRAHADGLERAMADGDGRTAELLEAREALQRRVRTLEEESERLAGERESLARQVEEKDALLARLEATQQALEDKLKEEIQKGDILLSRVQGKLQVDLVDKVLFDSGQAELSRRGANVLARVGAVLAGVEDRVIQVSGHTDDSPPTEKLQGTYPTNWELSVARAVNVVRFLSEQAGVPPRRLVAAGHGPFRPVAHNATPEGRARNRRIEILLTPALETAPALAGTRPPAAPVAKKAAAVRTPGKPARRAGSAKVAQQAR